MRRRCCCTPADIVQCDANQGGGTPVPSPGCVNQNLPLQVVVSLPTVTHTDPNKFSHAGGDFLCSFYGTGFAGFGDFYPRGVTMTGTGGGGDRIRGHWFADNKATPPGFVREVGGCGYMGAVIGSHCAGGAAWDVRPFACYYSSRIGGGVVTVTYRVIGYAFRNASVLPLGAPHEWQVIQFTSASTFYSLAWGFPVVLADPAVDCATAVYSKAISAASGANDPKCLQSGGAALRSWTVTAGTVGLSPA
jgi:hypothetical protein